MNTRQTLFRRFLRLPLFTKILLANSAIVALGAIFGTVVTVWHVKTFPEDIHYELIAFFAVAGFLISFLVNRWALKLALAPLDELQEGVDRVAGGNLDIRVDALAISDERFDRLIDTFNSMVAQLEQDAAQLHWLSRRLLQSQEEERQRLARELHDEAAQALTSLLVQLRLLERAYDPAEAQRRVGELRMLTARALEDVRRVALDLRPTILDDLGLVPALEWRVDEINQAGPVVATFEASGMTHRLPREVELIFYRIAQEGLTNALRHAQASQIECKLTQAGRLLRLEVVDDGVGLDPVEQNRTAGGGELAGLGLVGMRERIGILGGHLSLISAPGEGCRLSAEATLPCNGRQPFSFEEVGQPLGKS